MTLVSRVAGVMRAYRRQSAGADEQAAARALGYTRRSDHPWGAPHALNHARAPVSEPAGACCEQREVFEDADFT